MSLFAIRRRRNGLCSARPLVIALCLLLFLYTYFNFRAPQLDPAIIDDGRDLQAQDEVNDGSTQVVGEEKEPGNAHSGASTNTIVLNGQRKRNAFVVASQKTEDTSWLETFFPEWERWIYHVDEPTANLTVPKNKGRESMVYLTFIIDNYDSLPDNVLFIHPTRFQWHNDDPDYDGLRMLRNFQVPYLEQEGYVNMRCVWVLGCPSEIRPVDQEDEHRKDVHAGEYYKNAFTELFPGKELPNIVGVSCCAQFAATKQKIRERRKSEYEHYRQWIMDTDLEDAISGRVLEYSWHMIFGKEPVHCPNAQACYCNVFGLCDLSCKEDSCEGRYILPPFSSLPKGWPKLGWKGEAREYTTTDL